MPQITVKYEVPQEVTCLVNQKADLCFSLILFCSLLRFDNALIIALIVQTSVTDGNHFTLSENVLFSV